MSNHDTVTPLWISHRGLKENAEENTLDAFAHAVEAGFAALETDLRLSKDHHIVLCHDATLERLAGDPRRVAELTRADLENVRLRGGSQLLFLEQFMSAFRTCNWSFDVKPEHGRQTIHALAKLLERTHPEKTSESRMRFCTWQRDHERSLMQLFPHASYYARKVECWQAGLAVSLGAPVFGNIKAGRTYAIPPRLGCMRLFRESFVTHYQQRGARTIAFLPQVDAEVEAALQANFDEILTDGRILDRSP